MKNITSILILGGTGRTGKLIVKKALDQGYHVTALARQPDKLKEWAEHPHLEILKGDVLNYPDVYNAVQGNDGLISTLGGDGKDVDVFTKGTSNIVRALQRSSVHKFVCLSSFGAGSSRRLADWKLRLLIKVAGWQNSFEAKAEQELLLYKSSINFSLVMASLITNEKR